MNSIFLNKILKGQNRTASLKVVFVDIQSYSKRRSQMQADVIDSFMQCLRDALQKTSQQYLAYAQENDLNFQKDLIALPSGDGAAVALPFEGLHDVHLFFAKELLRTVHEHNKKHSCGKFSEQGWCHCHPAFNICIGISDGKGIIYKDINDAYNVAGTVINMAARVMGLAGAQQILFSEDAYRQFIDMVDDVRVDERFREYRAPIKHDLLINVFQYLEPEAEYLNSNPVEKLDVVEKATALLKNLSTTFGVPDPTQALALDMTKALSFMETLSRSMGAITPPVTAIEAQSVEQKPEKDA
jgi:hypothetical protein